LKPAIACWRIIGDELMIGFHVPLLSKPRLSFQRLRIEPDPAHYFPEAILHIVVMFCPNNLHGSPCGLWLKKLIQRSRHIARVTKVPQRITPPMPRRL
jgi:hypothetical protein